MYEVDRKLSITRIVIIDDEPNQVDELISKLREKGYDVLFFRTPKEMYAYLDFHCCDILLIDISLYGQNDTGGIDVAVECSKRYPEALRICISRQQIVKLSVLDALNSLNPSINEGGRRIFEAFGNKRTPNEIITLLELLRGQHSKSDSAKILFDPEIKKLFEEDFAELVRRKIDVPEPRRQVMEIVKRLATLPFMGETQEIHLKKIGAGRSRTAVWDMNVYYGRDKIPYRSVIKIGFNDLITQEVSNYLKYVPQCINHGNYPTLKGHSTSRQIAGLTYGRLGLLDNDQPPPTLRDELLKKRLDPNVVKTTVKKIFENFAWVEDPAKPADIRTIFEEYSSRYLTLKQKDALVTIFNNSLDALKKETDLINAQGEREFFLLSKHNNRRLINIAATMEGDLTFNTYKESLVHGDFHLDNVIMPHGLDSEEFFIDFAHTGPHHCFLDHIVLELGVRFQLGDQIFKERAINPDDIDADKLKRLFADIISMECNLCDIAYGKPRPYDLSGEIYRMQDLIREIRAAAARRWSKEAPENYFAGFGLALAAALRLPVKSPFIKKYRMWFSVASGLGLTLYEEIRKKNIQVSLWNYCDESTDDERISSSIDLLSHHLENSLQRVIKEQSDSIITKLSSYHTEIRELREILTDDYPSIKSKLDDIITRTAEIKNDPQIQAGVTIGLPFLALQVSKKVQLPDKIRNHIDKIWGKVN